jgi:hypothetical protein
VASVQKLDKYRDVFYNLPLNVQSPPTSTWVWVEGRFNFLIISVIMIR